MNNPITKATLAALSAAYAELSSPEAIQWYKDTAQQAWLILAALCVMGYQLIEAHLLTPTEAEAPLSTPAPTPALAIHNIKAVVIPDSNSPRSSQAHIFYKR